MSIMSNEAVTNEMDQEIFVNVDLNTQTNHCEDCNRRFTTITGLKNHQRACKTRKENKLHTTPEVFVEQEPVSSNQHAKDICDAYEKVTVWRKNLFSLPKGNAAKRFIKEMTTAIDLWNTESPLYV